MNSPSLKQYLLALSVLSLLIFGGIDNLSAQSFQDITPINVAAANTEVDESAIAWGDYDNDGDLDLLVTGVNPLGKSVAVIYTFDSGLPFLPDSLATDSLDPVSRGSVDWGDYDNDGFLDILLTGLDSFGNPLSRIYHNDGMGDFLPHPMVLPGVVDGKGRWADYDQDGQEDFVLMGLDAFGNAVNLLYHNDGNGTFSLSNTNFPPFYECDAAWADIDLDGDLDLAMNGKTPSGSLQSVILRNDGNHQFIPLAQSLQGLMQGSISWGDYDNDGFPDLLMTGENSIGAPTTVLYHNSGNGAFQLINSGIVGLSNGSAHWGDYTDDGFLDLFVTGETLAGTEMRIYTNNGLGGFVEDVASSNVFLGVSAGSVQWGDFTGDTHLDLIVSGQNLPNFKFLSIYANTSLASTVPAPTPVTLQATTGNDSVWLSWDLPPGSPPGVSSGYTYNVYVGTAPGKWDIVSPLAAISTGFRHVIEMGNAGHRLSYPLTQQDSATYYWSVQVVDQRFQSSAFALEGTFLYQPTTPPGLVFPGDANHDQIANNLDLLPIGLYFSSTGPIRQNASLNWVGQTATDWGDTLTSGIDIKHTDCDGNGLIDADDTLAIVLNYNSVHTSNKSAGAASGVPLSFEEFPTVINPGDTLKLEIHLGNMDTNAVDFYGIAFSMEYDTSLVEPNGISMRFDSSWLGTMGQDMITLYHDEFDAGVTDIALVRTDHQDRSGFGKIADIIIVMDDDISKREIPLNLNWTDILAINAQATEIPVTGQAGTSVLETTPIEPALQTDIRVYPNPIQAGQFLHIRSDRQAIQSIRLFSLRGSEIALPTLSTPVKAAELNLNTITPGIYFLHIQTATGSLVKQVLIYP